MTAHTVVINSSIFVAIFKYEADAVRLIERAFSYERKVASAATWLESAMVCERAAKEGGGARFEQIVTALGIEVVAVTPDQARLALDAFRRFGKGRGAKAALNYGDCFVYALARSWSAGAVQRS